MTNNQLTDERLVKILSETQATIMEHNSRCVRGSVEVDARLFESMIMELQVRRKTDKPPVHPTVASEKLDDETLQELIEFRRTTFEYHSKEGNKVQTIIHGVTLSALRELQERRKADSEPVMYCMEGNGLDPEAVSTRREVVDAWVNEWNTEDRSLGEPIYSTVPLYRHAQPAPASEVVTVTNDMAYAFHHALTDSMLGADDVEEIKTGLRAVFANLTAPVLSAKCPERLPCSVLLEPGLRFGKGIKTSTVLAALARREVYESEMAALSPEEKEEFRERIADFKAFIAQPAPVVTFYRNGIEAAAKWIDQQREAYDSEHGWSDPNTGSFEFGNDAQREYSSTLEELAEGIRAMHPNARSSPVIPDRWIPVSERMPEGSGTYQVWNGKHVGAVPFLFGSFQCLNPEQVTHWMPTAKPPLEMKP